MEARFPANFEKRSNFTPLEGVIRAGQRKAKRRVFPAFLRGEWRYAVCAVSSDGYAAEANGLGRDVSALDGGD